MHRVLAPWTRRLARDGGAPPPASALKVAEQVRRLLSQALRLADRPELFSGDLGSLGPAPAKGIGESELPLELPAKEKRSEPRPPREREPRPRGFGRIVIRPLDPSVRSQLVVEEGVTVVVINSRYPMFEERRGDIWYQLETAAREICATIEGASLGEYERRVSEIIVTAFKLRARRRRRRPTGRQLDLM